jgi:hypothetical protein
MQIYRITNNGYSEYLITCPECDHYYTIYEIYKGKPIKNDKMCPHCQYELPIKQGIYSFIWSSKDEVNMDVPYEVKQLYPPIFTFHVYSNEINDDNIHILK